jgi:hypothetical protein
MFRVLRIAKSQLAGRAAGLPGPRVSFLGYGDGLVLVRARPISPVGANGARHTNLARTDRQAPLPPRSAPSLLEPLVSGLGSSREELGGTQAPWGRLRAGGAPPIRSTGCPVSIPIGPLGG